MKQINTINEYNLLFSNLPKPIALVPTMGFLHEGHLSLIREARKSCATLVVSIFVNPTQFSEYEDLDSYPRDLQRDLSLLKAENVDIVFTPKVSEMYDEGFSTWVKVSGITQVLEGKSRPNHFKGVATVLTKLFNIIHPATAYFGQKDAQQAIVIKKLVKDLNYDISIEVLPIIREKSGLALSSRNKYLNEDEKHTATVLYKSLLKARSLKKEGTMESSVILEEMRKIICKEPLVRIDYISINDVNTLEKLKVIGDKALISLAVYVGKTRLIDNIVI